MRPGESTGSPVERHPRAPSRGDGAAPDVATPDDFLVRGELAERDARELAALKDQIRAATGRFCHCYKETGLRRRLAVRMRAHGIHRYGEYARLLRRDEEEYARLLRQLTIHVSRFFRNPEVWDAIAERVVPALFDLDDRVIRVWSAGCAGGEEPYTLAILLVAYAKAHGLEARLERFRVVGTDIDRNVLETARRAEYDEAALVDVPDRVRARWFDDGPPYRPLSEIRERVRFERADVLGTRFPSRLHLILCRNLVIYLDRTTQPRLYEAFHKALLPGGFLVLGKVEALIGPVADGFRLVANRERIYRKR